MSLLSFKIMSGKAVALSIFIFGLLSIYATVGVDKFEIYLNEKLIFSQSLDKPVDAFNLKLTEANAGDRLIIRYMQCNAPQQTGKGRMISLRDELGNIVEEWKFKESKDSDARMVIPVSDLLNAQKNRQKSLAIYYSAEGRLTGTRLAILQLQEEK